MAQLYLTEPQGEETNLHPSQSEAGRRATELRKRGITTVISKVTTKSLPIRDLLSGAFNKDAQIFESKEKVRVVQGVKHPKIAKDG